ncbi:MAG: hypothetical protein COV46_07650 [Deltaproteobacteria bacterium CG11_big_fil_rev_8_21_14_0_20_49_13]|nr:MAG: hypothetical protein COV46_07650 [Deltaproteobacteria bacterium CG11_big_fil_rev_8_21_14_0_20_49_13]
MTSHVGYGRWGVIPEGTRSALLDFYYYLMMLCHYLTPLNVVILKDVTDRDTVFTRLTEELCKHNSIRNEKRLAQAILDREYEGSTFLPTGIAIPHARVTDVEEITLVAGVVPGGFKETPDSDPTYMIILFFSPVKEKEFGRHLKLLAKISSVFRDPSFVKETASLGDIDKIFSAIQQKEREMIEE